MQPLSDRHRATAARTGLGLPLLALALAGLGGCSLLGVAMHVAGPPKVKVPAQYRDLSNQSIAVLVSADDETLLRYPQARLAVCQAVSARLARIPGARLMNPRQVIRFQDDNPRWEASSYGQLLDRLKVDRLIHVDLNDYTTREPGNEHLWQGVIAGQVTVAVAGGDPARGVFATEVRALFPENHPVGLHDANDQAIQLGMLETFSRYVQWLFVDHEEDMN